MVTLEPRRLFIRNFAADDWQELQALAIKYQTSPGPTSAEEVQGMAEWFASGDDPDRRGPPG